MSKYFSIYLKRFNKVYILTTSCGGYSEYPTYKQAMEIAEAMREVFQKELDTYEVL